MLFMFEFFWMKKTNLQDSLIKILKKLPDKVEMTQQQMPYIIFEKSYMIHTSQRLEAEMRKRCAFMMQLTLPRTSQRT